MLSDVLKHKLGTGTGSRSEHLNAGGLLSVSHLHQNPSSLFSKDSCHVPLLNIILLSYNKDMGLNIDRSLNMDYMTCNQITNSTD
jgi:hypothetical protein